MFNRLISNIVLGFFVMVLVVVYGVAKQQPTYSSIRLTQGDQAESITKKEDAVAMATKAEVETVEEVEALIPMPNGTVVNARLADTQQERQQGLSGTEPLAADEGMLFVFDKLDTHGIWMKEMNYDLDIIWLDEEGKVIHIVAGAKSPLSGGDLTVYRSEDLAKYVLEIPAGKAAEYGLATGLQVAVS